MIATGFAVRAPSAYRKERGVRGGNLCGFPRSCSVTRPQATTFAQQKCSSKTKTTQQGGFRFGAAGRIRTADLILTKKPWTLLRRTHSCRGRTSNPLCCKGLEVLLVLMCFNTYREVLRRFGAFVGRIVGKMPCVRRKAATQEKSRFECATLATGMSTSPLKWECSFASALSHKQEYLRICSLPFQRCSYQPQP